MTAEEFKGKRNMIPVQDRVNSIDYMVTHNLFTEKEMISFAEAYHQEKVKDESAFKGFNLQAYEGYKVNIIPSNFAQKGEANMLVHPSDWKGVK